MTNQPLDKKALKNQIVVNKYKSFIYLEEDVKQAMQKLQSRLKEYHNKKKKLSKDLYEKEHFPKDCYELMIQTMCDENLFIDKVFQEEIGEGLL